MLTLIQKLAHLCLKPLIALFDFPIVPVELTMLVNKLFEYIQAGTGILNFFVPFDVIRPAIDVFLAVWAVEHAYQLVLWVLPVILLLAVLVIVEVRRVRRTPLQIVQAEFRALYRKMRRCGLGENVSSDEAAFAEFLQAHCPQTDGETIQSMLAAVQTAQFAPGPCTQETAQGVRTICRKLRRKMRKGVA